MKVSVLLVVAGPVVVSAQQSLWGQCGGIGYSGATNCGSGAVCTTQNAYYAQCVPGSGGATTTTRATTTGGNQATTTPVRTTTTTGAPPSGTGLDAIWKSKGKKYIGFASDPTYLSDSRQTNILKAEAGQLSPENSMKWDATEPSRGSFSFGNSDQLVNFATSNGKIMRGHTLLWHAQLPQWVKNINDKATLTTVIQNHVAGVAGHFKGKIYAWDVANEVISDGGGIRSASDSHFTKVFGDFTFLDVAFKAAKAADPNAKLCLNDYNINSAGNKLNTFLQVVRDLKSRGVPIDCVGTQSHLGVGNVGNYASVLNQLGALGVEVQITELDIATPNTSFSSAQMSQQATDYKTVAQACKALSSCTGITIWGVSDARTWITGRHPLLWDENYNKKQAYTGFASGF